MRLHPKKPHAFCIPKKSVIPIVVLVILVEAAFILFYLKATKPIFLVFALIGAIIGVTLLSISLFGVIVIRKDCFNCQFAFHILEHEKSHLRLNSLNELAVEQDALKQTYTKLIPLLLSNPKLCKECGFMWRRMYGEATLKFIKEN